MARLDGKVAFITGAGRGQGRAHAVKLASEGADIIALDICADIETMDYSNATPAELAETVALVEAEGRRIVATVADVRDFDAVCAGFQAGFDQLGRIDIVIANAGILKLSVDVDPIAEWRDIIDVNLTGVFHTVRAAIPSLIEGGRGGSIVITSSTAGIRGKKTHHRAGGQAYYASKRGLVGLMEVLALDLAPHMIRVNSIHPAGVATDMIMNASMLAMIESEDPALQNLSNALPIDVLMPEDIANAVAWLVSDEAHFMTGVSLPLDAGFTIL